ncbi:serine hydrolase [Sphingobium scionense]
MTATLREQRVESASIAVIRNGRIVSTGAWGMAGPNRAATVSTPYNLASLTKPLTAEVILRLVSVPASCRSMSRWIATGVTPICRAIRDG